MTARRRRRRARTQRVLRLNRFTHSREVARTWTHVRYTERFWERTPCVSTTQRVNVATGATGVCTMLVAASNNPHPNAAAFTRARILADSMPLRVTGDGASAARPWPDEAAR